MGVLKTTETGLVQKIVSSGSYTYVAVAKPPGDAYADRAAHEAAAVWSVVRFDSTGSSQLALGVDDFIHVATDLTALDYLD